jgi:phage gp46-like protein
MTDVRLFHTANGGEIEVKNGVVMDDGLATAAYLSLFGGNRRDNGSDATKRKQWWGNLGETDPARVYRSETGYLLGRLLPIPANLRRLEEAAARDLAWMVGTLADSVTATATMPALNTVDLKVKIVLNGKTTELLFSMPWGARSA